MKAKKPVNLNYTHEGEETVKQILVVYVNVGSLAPPKAFRHMEAVRDGMLPLLQKLPKDTGAVFLPCRAKETSVELVPHLSWGFGAATPIP